MDTVLRAVAIYVLLWLLLRIAGRRTLAELTSFDLVLLLIVSEAVQQALLGDDASVTGAALVIVTFLLIDIVLARVQQLWPATEKVFNGVPTVIVENGQPLVERMRWARVGEDDVLEAARRQQGLERIDQIKYAVLERSGGISIIAKPSASKET